jgi:hypothetical protein
VPEQDRDRVEPGGVSRRTVLRLTAALLLGASGLLRLAMRHERQRGQEERDRAFWGAREVAPVIGGRVTEAHFSFRIPKGWTYGPGLLLPGPDERELSGPVGETAPATLTISSIPVVAGQPGPTSYQLVLKVLQQSDPSARLLVPVRTGTLDDEPAWIAVLAQVGTNGPERHRICDTSHAGRGYELWLTCQEHGFPAATRAMDEIMDSWRWI